MNQVMDTQTINNTPLAERNWVYLAQLSTGVVPSYGTRGGGHGDYSANGQRAEQNDFRLDGADNNVDIVDYMNGSIYSVSPPPMPYPNSSWIRQVTAPSMAIPPARS